MLDKPTSDEIRRRVGASLTDADVEALADWYFGIAQAVAGFPSADLQAIEPPLRSTPGPHVRSTPGPHA